MPQWLYKPLRLLTLGHYAVDIFIVLSGFCLALPVVLKSGQLRGGAINFYQRRARRIIPPYYISMVFAVGVTWLTVQLGGEPGQAITYLGVITHLLLIHDLFHQTAQQINGVLWSVSVEWRIYFLFPFVVYLWRKIGPAATTVTAVLLSYLLFRTMQHTPLNVMDVFGMGACPQYIGLFVMGTLGAYLAFGKNPATQWMQKTATSPWTVLFFSLLVISVTLAEWSHSHNIVLRAFDHFRPLEIRDYLVGIWAATLMAAAGKNPQYLAFRFLSSRVLVFLGTFAYSSYLIHEPLVILMKQTLVRFTHIQPFQMFLLEIPLGIAVVFSISYLFHLAFERPFMSKPGQSAPKTERQAEVEAIVNPAP